MLPWFGRALKRPCDPDHDCADTSATTTEKLILSGGFAEAGEGALGFGADAGIGVVDEFDEVFDGTSGAVAVEAQGARGVSANDGVDVVQSVDELGDQKVGGIGHLGYPNNRLQRCYIKVHRHNRSWHFSRFVCGLESMANLSASFPVREAGLLCGWRFASPRSGELAVLACVSG